MKKRVLSVGVCVIVIFAMLLPLTVAAQDNVTAFVERMYQTCLGRPSDAEGVAFWIEQLATGQKPGAELAEFFFLSEEFVTQENSDDVFVERLYNTLLNRQSDAAGKQEWMRRLNRGCARSGLLRNFIMSDEFSVVCSSFGINKGDVPARENRDINLMATVFVYRLYETLLSRQADTDGLNFWTGRIANEDWTAIQVAEKFVFSNEMDSRSPNATTFVTLLYRAFMDREPDMDGIAYWTGLMAAGASKERIFNGFATSPEFGEICANYGVALGSPIAEPAENQEQPPAPAEPEPEPEPKPGPTASQAQAVKKAEEYLRYTAFSKAGLVKQLEYEGFSNADATYAVNNILVDWKEQAAKKAQLYLDFMAFSRRGLIDQLVYEGFTREEATYGANAVGL